MRGKRSRAIAPQEIHYSLRNESTMKGERVYECESVSGGRAKVTGRTDSLSLPNLLRSFTSSQESVACISQHTQLTGGCGSPHHTSVSCDAISLTLARFAVVKQAYAALLSLSRCLAFTASPSHMNPLRERK